MEFKAVGLDAIEHAQGLLSKFTALISGLAITGVTALTAYVTKATDAFIQQGEHLKTLSTQFGITVPQLSAFEQGAKLVGGSAGMVDSAFQRLSMRIGSMQVMFNQTHKLSPMLVADFNALGVKLAEHNGTMRNTNDIMTDTVDKLAKMSNITEMNRIALRLLGGEGPQFIAMLKNSGESMQQLQQDATRLGATMSTNDAEAADKLEMAHYRLNVVMEGVSNTLARAMMPAMQAFTNFMVGPGIGAFKSFATFIGSVVIPGLINLVDRGLKTVVPWLETNVPKAIALARGAFLSLMNSGVVEFFKDALKTAIQDLPTILDDIKTGAGFVSDKFNDLTDKGGRLAPALFAVAGGLIAVKTALTIQALIKDVTFAIEGLKLAMYGAAAAEMAEAGAGALAILPLLPFIAVVAAIGVVVGLTAYLIITHWTQVKNFAVTVWNTVTTTIKNFVTTIVGAITGFVTGLVKVWQKFASDPMYWIGYAIGWIITKWAQFNETMHQKARDLVSGIGHWISTLWPEHIQPWLVQTLINFATWLANLKSSMDTKFNDLIKSIGDWFNAVNWGLIGVDIVKGIIGGITGAAGWAKDQIGNFIAGLLKGAKDASQSRSPSKLFADQVGLPIAQGIAVGITGGKGIVQSALNAALPQATAPHVNYGSAGTFSLSSPSQAAQQQNDVAKLILVLEQQNEFLRRIAANTGGLGSSINNSIALALGNGLHT